MEKLEHLTEEEKKAVAEIKKRVGALVGNRLKGFYLFGSKARGDYDSDSDVDVAILVNGLDRDLMKKIIDIVVDVELKYLIFFTSLVLSWTDFVKLRTRERRIALDIEREGIPL